MVEYLLILCKAMGSILSTTKRKKKEGGGKGGIKEGWVGGWIDGWKEYIAICINFTNSNKKETKVHIIWFHL